MAYNTVRARYHHWLLAPSTQFELNYWVYVNISIHSYLRMFNICRHSLMLLVEKLNASEWY